MPNETLLTPEQFFEAHNIAGDYLSKEDFLGYVKPLSIAFAKWIDCYQTADQACRFWGCVNTEQLFEKFISYKTVKP